MFESEKSRIASNYAEIINVTQESPESNINIEKTSGKLPFIIKDYFFVFKNELYMIMFLKVVILIILNS